MLAVGPLLQSLLALILQGVLQQPDAWLNMTSLAAGASECVALYPVDAWSQLHGDALAHLQYCLAHQSWFNRSDDQTRLPDGACDYLMAKPLQRNWTRLVPEARVKLGKCAMERLMADLARDADPATLYWMPQDLFYAPLRPYTLLTDMTRLLSVIWQHEADQDVELDVLLSEAYQGIWRAHGLSCEHYGEIHDCETLRAFRERATLTHYWLWNDMQPGQLRAGLGLVQWLSRAMMAQLEATVATPPPV